MARNRLSQNLFVEAFVEACIIAKTVIVIEGKSNMVILMKMSIQFRTILVKFKKINENHVIPFPMIKFVSNNYLITKS